MIALVFAVAPANAQSIAGCTTGQAPAAYVGTGCSGECSIAGSGAAQYVLCVGNVEAIAVEDYAIAGNRNYSIWGTDGTADTYCCFVNDNSTHNIQTINLYGTTGQDNIAFTYSGRNVTHAGRNAYADSGDTDTITGSDDTTHSEFLFGEGDQDIIYGNDGDDYIEGNADIDELHGGDGDDYIDGGLNADDIYGDDGADECHGQAGDDFIVGGIGDDVLYGDGDADIIWGQEGNDDLYGGRGVDVVCGGATDGAGTNYLHAVEPGVTESPNDVDHLWEPSSANAPTGAGAVSGDQCGHSTFGSGWAGANCNYSNSTRPAECYE